MTEEPRITIESLRFYVPIFKRGDEALTQLYRTDLSPRERNRLETIAKLRELSTKKIVELSRPLIITEINKILFNSYLKDEEGIFDLLYYAGVNGMVKGLKKFDVNKINKSSTNYLFQWITTYAKRELLIHEAPFNIPPSRFAVYKKIGAVRSKLATVLQRPPTNEEVYNFFQSGEADVKTLHGPVKKSIVSKANLSITPEQIEEQREFEQKFNYMITFDPVEEYRTPVKEEKVFTENIFGIFLNSYNFTKEAGVVLKSYLNFDDAKIEGIPIRRFNSLERLWKKLLTDVNGPFYSFLKGLNEEDFEEFDIKSIMNEIENSSVKVDETEYIKLFEGEKIVRF